MRPIYFLVLLFILFISSCKENKQTQKAVGPAAEEAIPVRLISLSTEASRQFIPVTGFMSTEDQVRLSFKTGGVLDKIYVKEGDKIVKGQLIATIRPTEINALAEQASLGLQKAERDYNRVKALYQDSVATLEQMQNVKTAYEVAKQQVAQAKFNQGFIRLTAPADGFVLRKLKNDGELSEPGGPVIILGSLTPKKSWLLQAAVSDKEWTQISVGDSAWVEMEAFPDRSFNGYVRKKSVAADPVNGSFSVEIDLNLNGVSPAYGMFARAKIKTRYEEKGYVIPYEALIEANGKEASVFVSQDGKTAKRVEITIGEITNDFVRVVAGLEGYAHVVTSGSPYLRDGSSIQVIK